jgi:putative ABC transport system permease protein
VAASGGAPADVRRVLLAQGLVVGAGASVLGAAAGIGLFYAGLPLYEQLTHQQVWTRGIDWLAVVGVTLLGSVTGLLAALVPALSIGRLTPVAALAGRFPIRPGESRAHRPAFLVAGSGLVMLLLGGLWTAREFAPPPLRQRVADEFGFRPSPLPVVLAGFGLLLLIGGAVWSAPYVVRRLAGLGRGLPLSGRFAFRDAARHRFRTAAAAVALTMTVAGTVFAGFVVQSVAATVATDDGLPPHSMMLYVDEYGPVRATPERLDRMLDTVHDVVGPATTLVASRVASPDRRDQELGLTARGGGYATVMVVDEESLRWLVGDDAAALETFRSGGVVTTDKVRDGAVTAALHPGARNAENRWTLPAVKVTPGTTHQGELSSAWVSAATAAGLGLTSRPSSVLVVAERQLSADDMTRLGVHGIDAWSRDLDVARMDLVRRGVTAGAGLLTLLVVGIAVALSTAEGQADQATMAAVGAGPWRRRALGAMHGLFLGVVGVLLGVAVGLPGGAAVMQVDGVPGVTIPWSQVGAVLLVVPLLGWCAGWLAASSRLSMVRRTG